MQNFDDMPMRESMRDAHKKESIDCTEYYKSMDSSLKEKLTKD